MKKTIPIVLLFLGGLFSLMGVAFLLLLRDPALRGPGIFTGSIGGVLLFIGFVTLHKVRARARHLREHGHLIRATVVDAQIDYRTQVNYAPALLLRCEGTDAKTGQSHTFSAKLWSSVLPQGSLRGYEVDVLFDPNDPQCFEVRLDSLRPPQAGSPGARNADAHA